MNRAPLGHPRLEAAPEIETVAIMPRWKSATSDEWSIDTGVYEPRYLNDDRNRPPFPGECKCGAKE